MLRKMRGFTLIEVMIVIFIIMIAAAIVVPNVAVLLTSKKTTSQVEIVDQEIPKITTPDPKQVDNQPETGENKSL